VNQKAVITQKTVIWIYPLLLMHVCTGKDKARQNKTITLQQFVPCLYTVSSGRTFQCTNTDLSGCYILCRICSNHINTLLLNIILLASIKYVQHRKFDVSLTVHHSINLFLSSTSCTFALFCYICITLDASTCFEQCGLRSALNHCTARPLTESDVLDAVKYNLDLLKMSILLLETCRGI
jgi:hypothetical protein